MHNGRLWGEDTNLLPGWERIQKAAVNAISAPETWIPLGGAFLIHVTETDYQIANWASTHNPVFGSQSNADNFSDYTLYFSRMVYYSSVFLTPGGNNVDVWIVSKIKGAAIGLASTQLNEKGVSYIKHEGDRLRPDKTDYLSFPSGHTSKVAVHNMLTLRNLENTSFCTCAKTGLHIGISSITFATAWSRIEANRHYPTDVLIGAAIGNFLGSFIHDAFIGIDHNHEIDFSFSTIENNLTMNLMINF
jgi:membrane-associated phospholipid phosphatase